MRYRDSIFRQLLKPLSRRFLGTSAARHKAEAYDKSFRCWDHLVAMVYAQLADVQSLRELETAWNANSHHHYHLGTGRIARTTLGDANMRRPTEVFADVFAKLSADADRKLRQEGSEMVRIIDSSPIPLRDTITCRAWNGRIKGLKLHVVYAPGSDRPCAMDVTPANINDIEMGKEVAIEKGATYVFDKGYCSYKWWEKLHFGGALFVTRQKQNARFRPICWRPLSEAEKRGDGFTVVSDANVKLTLKGNAKLSIAMRRIRIRRDGGGTLTLVTNDMTRSASVIAGLYKTRWQIELLFRWIKQNLNLKTFLGRSENAIKLQLYAAMIAYLLLRLAARASGSKHAAIRFAELVSGALFTRKSMARIDKPPDVNACNTRPRHPLNQLEMKYV